MWLGRKSFLFSSTPIFTIVCSGCLGPIEGLYPPKADDPSKTVYVVNHNDRHTGIVVKRQDIPTNIWPEHHDFAAFDYVEVGWGDRDYYQTEQPTLWMTVKAALWPTESVLHITGFSAPVQRYFPESEIIEIDLSQRGFERLCMFIGNSYAKDSSGKAIKLGPGLYKNSQFYLARGKFHALKTCNTWTAKAIRSAGCPITPLYAITARNVMYQGRKCGRIIQPASFALLAEPAMEWDGDPR